MDVIEARKIIEDNNLIPKNISKHIINYIIGNSKILDKKVLNYVSEKEVKFYKNKVKKINVSSLLNTLKIKNSYFNFPPPAFPLGFDVDLSLDGSSFLEPPPNAVRSYFSLNKTYLG